MTEATQPQTRRGALNAMGPVMLRLLPLIILGTALCSLANIVLTRSMNTSEYGAFSFFLSSISLMSLIGLLGFHQTLPRFLSRYERDANPELTLGFLITVVGLTITATAIVTGLGIYAVVPMIQNTAAHRCLNEGYYLATAMALIVLFSAYLTFHKHTLVASSAGPDGAVYQFVLILAVLVAQLLPHTHSGLLAVEVVGSMGLAAAACLAVQLIWCTIKLKDQIQRARPSFRVREWCMESLPVAGSAVIGTLVYSADIIAVRLIAGSDSAAEYAVASSLATFVIIPRLASGKYFSQEAPHVAGAERSAILQRLIRRVLSFNFVSAAAIGLGIALFNQLFLGFYGKDYLSAWPALLLLILARALEGPAPVGVKLLNLEGFGGTIAQVSLWTGAVFIGLLALLVSWLGQNGAGAAAIAFVLLSNTMIHRRAVRYTGLRLTPSLRS